MRPFRQQVASCIHGRTFKYFVSPATVDDLWCTLATTYGQVHHNRAFNTVQIDAEHFVLRAVGPGNPITVLRKCGCTNDHINALHVLMGFEEIASC